MRDKEYFWYMLANAPGFGPKSIHYIYKNLQTDNLSIRDLFKLDTEELSRRFPEIGRSKFSKTNFSCLAELETNNKLYNTFEKLTSDGVSIIGLDDDRYPKFVLKSMGDSAPSILYCKGYLPLLDQKGVAVVGARDIGEFETTTTKTIAKELAKNGINVISGYAKGVDTSAHLGALQAQGTTTMILSFGINHITVRKELKDKDWEKNALFVSQFEPYEKFSGVNAMIRNRLICAMSKAIVVIKSGPEKDNSGKMSGTFNTAKTALQMNIPVFVLSPKILNPTPQGNVDLIKIGAIEFSDTAEILKHLEEQPQKEQLDVSGQSIVNGKIDEPYQTNLFEAH